MTKPYQRGIFRAIKTTPHPEKFPKFQHYEIQVAPYSTLQGGVYSDWVTIDAFDYAGNARLRVRNLHAASCTHIDLVDSAAWESFSDTARRYVRTGKRAKPLDLKPCKDV